MYAYDELDRTLINERVSEFRDQVKRRLSGELTPSNHAFESHPPRQPYHEADNRTEKGTGDAVTPPQQCAR